ncbi:hypothetical protein M0R04_15310 [Candidatus Dojkabacteria bacterium]|jgi:hypothetical protein|nr:hypothetical protein [Candidatus Dojkabacteria bacterium]
MNHSAIEFHNRLSATTSALKGIEDWFEKMGNMSEEEKAFLDQVHDSFSLFETLRENLARKIKREGI